MMQIFLNVLLVYVVMLALGVLTIILLYQLLKLRRKWKN